MSFKLMAESYEPNFVITLYKIDKEDIVLRNHYAKDENYQVCFSYTGDKHHTDKRILTDTYQEALKIMRDESIREEMKNTFKEEKSSFRQELSAAEESTRKMLTEDREWVNEHKGDRYANQRYTTEDF